MRLRPPSQPSSKKRAFSLLELVIVVLIVTLLAGVLAPRLAERGAAARDTRRLADLRALQQTIEQYRLDLGEYPPASSSAAHGGWDVSHDGDFIPELVRKGYLQAPALDPLNDAAHHYRYYVYPQGSYGCAGTGDYYVLGIKAFELEQSRARHPSAFACSGRDWGLELDYVTGGGAGYE